MQSSGWRQIPDVAFDADPNSGVAVYDSYDYGSSSPWVQVGGTSLSAPCWAGLVAIADQLRVSARAGARWTGRRRPCPILYGLPAADFHDITSGSNGGFSAGAGYDMVTGLGSPVANQLVPDLAAYVPPPYIVGTTPSLSAGTLTAGTTTIAINFNEPVVGADVATNYELHGLGPDGLLGTADDAVVPLSADGGGTTATLTFPAPEKTFTG